MFAPGPHNPFARRQKLWHRPNEVRRQLQALADARPSFILVGDEQSGKSELLALVAKDVAKSGRRVIIARLDGHALAGEVSDGQRPGPEFWREALRPLAQVEDPEIRRLHERAASRHYSGACLEPLSRALYQRGIALLVQVDDFHALVLNSSSNLRGLLSTVRKIAGLGCQGITLTLVSRFRIDELHRMTEAICAGSPFFNVFDELILEPLSGEGVNGVLDLCNDRFSVAERGLIVRAAGGHPEFLWRAAEAMWEAHERAVEPEHRLEEVGYELLHRAGPLLRTTWSWWPLDARFLLLRVLLAELGAPLKRAQNRAGPGGWLSQVDEPRLIDHVGEAIGDQRSLLRELDRLDSRLRLDLPAPTVPLRHLVEETVALLRRRGLLASFLRHLGMQFGLAPGAPLPTVAEYLRRRGWIDVERSRQTTSIRVGVIAWWLLDGLAPLARQEISMRQWLLSHQLERVPISSLDALDEAIATLRDRLILGARPCFDGDDG